MKRIALVLLASMFTFSAHADLLLEPYLGYYMGSSESAGDKDDVNGMGLGARIGWQQLGLMLGGEFMTGKWKDDNNPASDLDPTIIGAFIGYNFPILVRVYGMYGLSNKVKLDNGTTSGDLEGDFMKLGVGFTGLPFVSINFEYITASMDEFEGLALANSIDLTTYGVSVSLPLTF